MKHIVNITCCFILFLIPAVFPTAAASETETKTQRCTINEILGPIVHTSCQDFNFGEQINIADINGRKILPWQIPIPCEAEIEYICISKKNCATIQAITIQKSIEKQPE